MATPSEDICVVCRDSVGGCGRKLGSKGRTTFIEVSKKRADGLYRDVSSATDHFVHNECYKSYTAPKNIQLAQKTNSAADRSESPVPSLRSKNKPFKYETHCLICAMELNFEAVKRHPERSSISHVEIVSTEHKSVLQTSLLEVCASRNDTMAVDVKSRINFAGDIRAVDAKYHRTCMQAFLSKQNLLLFRNTTIEKNARNLNKVKNDAFLNMCAWLMEKDQQQCQFTVHDLQTQLSTYLPSEISPYSIKHIKRRLCEHFGKEVIISEVGGRTNVVTFSKQAASILHETFVESTLDIDDDEDIQMAKHVGSTLGQVLREKDIQTEIYPTPKDIDIRKLEEEIPKSLQMLITSMFTESRSEQGKLKKKTIQVSICHIIMQAACKQGFISPLLLSIGLFIHQSTRSRVLLDVLSSLGLSASYDQVISFERSAVDKQSVHNLPAGLVEKDDGGGFCQWVADNFDYNEDTISGHDTTHTMGIITCQAETNTYCEAQIIKRKNITAEEIVKVGDFSSFMRPYNQPAKSMMSDLQIKALTPIKVSTKEFFVLYTLWLFSSLLRPNPPNWQGFMSQVVTGSCQCTAVVYNPMIPLNPQTNEAVYSTMVFVQCQAKKAGMCCATLTFDQPLYLKSYKIKKDNNPEFEKIFLRLGGFHQLMSFLGAGCKLMEDSGLDELWATSYARKSLPKMMEGKSYTKTLRACLLTDAALHLVLLKQHREIPKVDTVDCIHNEILGDDDDDDDEQPSIADKIECTSAAPKRGTMWTELQDLYQDLVNKDISLDDAVSHEHLHELYTEISELKKRQENSRTGKLWVMYMDLVSIVRLFIRAERTGNWQLYLKATQEMLPFFAAAGHNHYSKCCRLYLQDCQELCQCLKTPMEEGLFTVRRNDKLFWSGTWSDMTIEQCLMRAGKTQGGLINITHKEAARTKWLLTAHVVAQYTDALRSLTDTFTGTWSEQHREVHPGNIRRDHQDLQKYVEFLQMHNPFIVEKDQLRNVATGLIADHRVNVEIAVTIGQNIQKKMNNQRFGDIVLKKSDKASTFAVMRKAVKVDGEQVRVSSAELYHRLLSPTYTNGPPDPNVFTYELATVSPALFYDDGSMRKSPKSVLAQHILQMDPDITVQGRELGTAAKVCDGCALLHQIPWPKVGTMDSVCESFLSAVTHGSSSNSPLWVIFDTYDVITTKDPEQKRRKLQQVSCADIVVTNRTPVPSNKTAFLSNKHNKQNLIKLLSVHLENAGISVENAGDEGDADVVIVKKAIEIANSQQLVFVIADDTDILILLLYHACHSSDIYLCTKHHTISIKIVQDVLGRELCMCLLFAHAMSGCDTTSSLYGMGKLRHFKALQSSQQLRSDVLIFGDTSASKEEISCIGERFVEVLYCGKSGAAKGLDSLRYMYAISPKYVTVERMPPTSRAMHFHSLRVHHQVSTWKHLETVLDKADYGFSVESDDVQPIITDKPPAPPQLLQDVRCSCKTSRRLCTSCSCSKKGIPCSIHCKCEANCENSPQNI